MTAKKLVKAFLVFVLLIFLLPLLLHQLDSDEEDRTRNFLKKSKLIKKSLDVLKEDPVKNERGPESYLKMGVLGNFESFIEPRVGAGENGEPVVLTSEEKTIAERSVRDYGFNMVVSDKISMTRTIPDTRLDECRYWQYPEKLPTASVILVFHNEGWSTLVRTVHSVINMTPSQLLHEVVMVDDFSEKEHLKSQLDEYMKKHFPDKVKIFRNSERVGLIGTRTLGAKYATGDVIVFLDAHCECNKNWLPPLLARIAYDRTIMTVPTIDGIDWNNFQYRPVYQGQHHFRGIFEWGFLYKESMVPQKELDRRKHHSEPYRAPTHAGGLFAMDRKYFFELGAYDPGLLIWGGENFELSFKIWQCGGSIEWVPCSRVGHVYRNHMPYGFGKVNPKIPIILVNYMRVVEVWLDDEYKEYFYTREPTIRGYDIGDISKQLQFKREHKCKSFKWFMENVAYEVYDKFPPPPRNLAWGEIRDQSGENCWDTRGQHPGSGPVGLSRCHHYGGNQLLRLNVKGQLAVGERCLELVGQKIKVAVCSVSPTGYWSYDKESGIIEHTHMGECIGQGSEPYSLELVRCDRHDQKQKWSFVEIRSWK